MKKWGWMHGESPYIMNCTQISRCMHLGTFKSYNYKYINHTFKKIIGKEYIFQY